MKFHVVFLPLFALVLSSTAEKDPIAKLPKVPPEVAKILKERKVTPENALKFLDNLKAVDWKKFTNPDESGEQKLLKLTRLLMTNFEESFPKKEAKKEPQLKQIDSDDPECEKVIVDENGEKFCAVAMKSKQKKSEKEEVLENEDDNDNSNEFTEKQKTKESKEKVEL